MENMSLNAILVFQLLNLKMLIMVRYPFQMLAMTVYSLFVIYLPVQQTLVLRSIRCYGQKKKTNEQTNKKEKTTEDKNDTIITSEWVILDKLFRNLAGSAKRE